MGLYSDDCRFWNVNMLRPGLLNTKARYGSVAQLFHWTTALLILILMPMGVIMHGLPNGTSAEIADKVWLYSLHKTLGLTVLIIATVRIIWALLSPHPRPLHPERKMETFAASTIHWILYGSILLVPVIGYVHHAASTGFAPVWGPFPNELSFIPKSEALSKLSGYLHFLLAWLMAGSVGLHIAGALKHSVIDRDATLSRMIPFMRPHVQDILDPAPALIRKAAPALAVAVFACVFLIPSISELLIGKAETASDPAPQQQVEVSSSTSTAGDVPKWIVDLANSALSITIIQLGAPVAGKFESWQAEILFDPESLDKSSVDVRIDTKSLALGGVTDQAKSVDFLDVETHPQARFAATEFTTTENGYLATGELTLHGKTITVSLPFDLKIDGDNAAMSGSISLNRMDFDVGAKGFADEQSVAFNVQVDVVIAAQRAK
ncbi:MAG: cytochrome b/b6 domain-containing protein [Pseudomonadota bacterium]